MRHLLGIAVLAALAGCGQGDPEAPAAATFVELDSAGVQLLVTPGSDAFAPLGWKLDTIPELVLGVEEAPSGPFMRVVGAELLPEGEILVVDAGRRELLRFDTDGRELARRGRMGQGPGEFADARLVPTAGTDSVIVYDISQARVTVFSPDREHMRIQRLESDWHGRLVPIGALPGAWLRQNRTHDGGTFGSAMFSEGPVEEHRVLFLSDASTGADRELASFTGVRMFVSEKHGPRGPMGHIPMALVPHAPTPTWVLTADGLLASEGRSLEIREIDLHGQLVRILRIDARPEPVTSEMIEGWIRGERRLPAGASIDPAHLAEYADRPIPETLPSFGSLVVDASGWLWAQLYEWDPHVQRRWVVLDPEGRAHGIVRTPVDFEVHSIGADRVLGVWRSQWGEEFVHSYRLRRVDRTR